MLRVAVVSLRPLWGHMSPGQSPGNGTWLWHELVPRLVEEREGEGRGKGVSLYLPPF